MAKKTTGEVFTDLLYNKWFWVGVVIIIAIWYVYNQGKKSGQGTQTNLPNSGTGIPVGWTATPAAQTIYDAMDTGGVLWGVWDYGTDEETILNTLTPLTLDQRVAVNNAFNTLYEKETGKNMVQWFQSELSADDFSLVMSLFNGSAVK